MPRKTSEAAACPQRLVRATAAPAQDTSRSRGPSDLALTPRCAERLKIEGLRPQLFADVEIPARSVFAALVEIRPPAVPCGCAACIIAAVKSPNAERGQLSACESMRRKRERCVFGMRARDPGQGFLLADLARFLRIDRSAVRVAAKRLGILRKLEGDDRYAPLTRRQAKRVIQALRAR